MLRWTLLVASLALVGCLPTLPDPGHLTFFSEDEFEDYLDAWLAIEEPKWVNATARAVKNAGDCEFAVNGDLGQPQPVYLRHGDYLEPTRATGRIGLRSGEAVRVACTGSGRVVQHPNAVGSAATVYATCHQGTLVLGAGWLSAAGEFRDITCSAHSFHDSEYTGETCYGGNRVIRTGFYVEGEFYPLYWSCFDPSRLEVLYVWYKQVPQNAVHQSGVARPSWLAGSFFPGVAVNTQYTQVQQKLSIAAVVGDELADKYVTSTQFLARGHLAAKTDFVFATGQRSTFYFINAAPQWQPFNAGNWNFLEQNMRARIGAAGYDAVVYTGTWGVSQLRDQRGLLVDIYLHRDANNNPQLPVPLYFYKVVYDPLRKIGTAFVSINNPHYTEAEVRGLTFCTDRCRNNADFAWLNWQPDRIDTGYSFCCDVDEFRRTVPHLPAFEVNGLLY